MRIRTNRRYRSIQPFGVEQVLTLKSQLIGFDADGCGRYKCWLILSDNLGRKKIICKTKGSHKLDGFIYRLFYEMTCKMNQLSRLAIG